MQHSSIVTQQFFVERKKKKRKSYKLPSAEKNITTTVKMGSQKSIW